MAAYERNRLGALFGALRSRLTAEQLQRLAVVLGNRKLEINEAQQLARERKLDPESLIAEARSNAASMIAREFGADVSDRVQEFERTSDQRAQLNDLNTELVYEGIAFTGAQIDSLSRVMAELQKVNLGSALKDTTQSIDEYIEKKNTENAAILNRARSILSPEQLDALRERLQRHEDYARLRRSQAIDRSGLSRR